MDQTKKRRTLSFPDRSRQYIEREINSYNNDNQPFRPSFQATRDHSPSRDIVSGAATIPQSKPTQNTRLSNGINVLSWDCGISNLCYCLIELLGDNEPGALKDMPNFRIIMWENLSLNSCTLMQATAQLVKELDSRPWMMDVDYVCVENQVLKNVQMKVMAHCIQCYFETRSAARSRENSFYSKLPNGAVVTRKGKGGPPVHLIQAQSKFKIQPSWITIPASIENLARRTRNKRAAVYIVSEILKAKNDITALNFLHGFEKKDDLSDSLLQGLYFLKDLKHKREQNKKLKQYLKQGVSIDIDATPQPKSKKYVATKNTGTPNEIYDDTLDGMNEGCEYDKEVPLPQLYRNKHFVIPRYDTTKADISMVKKYVRWSGDLIVDEDHDSEDDEILNMKL